MLFTGRKEQHDAAADEDDVRRVPEVETLRQTQG